MSAISLMVMMSLYAEAASVEEEQAEMVRILEDMKQFREQGNWKAVEKRYQQLSEFGKAKPTVEMHLLGAEAASNAGDVSAVKSRLGLALALGPNERAQQWYDSISQNYSPVTIKVPKKLESIPELQIEMMPFFPDQQLALAFAQEVLKNSGKYQGFLPFGDYTIGGSTFTVTQSGTGLVVVVKPEGSAVVADTGEPKEKNPKEPKEKKDKEPKEKKSNEPASSDSQGVGFRVDLGFSGGSASASSVAGQALPFGGVGTRMGVGAVIGLGGLNLVTEVGYHGMFGAGEAPVLGVLGTGYDATPTIYNGTFGWLAAEKSFQQVSVLIGPVVEFASVQTQGMELSGADLEYSAGQATYLPVEGKVLASGLSGGITYAGFSLGDGLNGGISTVVGSQSDGSRWYSWGQIALTVTSN